MIARAKSSISLPSDGGQRRAPLDAAIYGKGTKLTKQLKILTLALAAAMAVGGIAVLNASATVKGHFESDVEHTLLVGSEGHNTSTGEAHTTEFHIDEGEGIVCSTASYSGTTITKTTTEVTITPKYENCKTTDGTAVTVTTHKCDYTFFSHGTNAHGTVSVMCSSGEAIEIHHPNCTITVPGQAPNGLHMTQGANYKTMLLNGKHALTVNVTLKAITAEYHGGICIFLGTNHTAEMTGAVTLAGTNTAGEAVNITHT